MNAGHLNASACLVSTIQNQPQLSNKTTKMATKTTPAQEPPSSGRQRNSSHSRTRIPSRPTTPLRPPSRTSLRASQTTPNGGASATNAEFPLASLEPAFAELSDSMADLEANFMHLQLLNESLGRFNENFGAFLYGMNMSAFCVDFPEVRAIILMLHTLRLLTFDWMGRHRYLNPSPGTRTRPRNYKTRRSVNAMQIPKPRFSLQTRRSWRTHPQVVSLQANTLLRLQQLPRDNQWLRGVVLRPEDERVLGCLAAGAREVEWLGQVELVVV